MKEKLVLIADDDPVQRKLLSVHLCRIGFQVATAEDGADALEQARCFAPDAIVCDVLMPRLDGFKLCEAVREDHKLAHVPLVLTTSGHVNESDRKLARSVGANDIVPRTPGLEEVIKALKASLLDELPKPVDTPILFSELRAQFLANVNEQSMRLVDSLASEFDVAGAKRLAHRWAGVGGTLGLPQISQRAYEMETLLDRALPEIEEQLRMGLEEICKLSVDAAQTPGTTTAVPAPIVERLSGKRFALVGFEPPEAGRISNALEQAQAFSRLVVPTERAFETELRLFDVVVLNLSRELDQYPGFQPAALVNCQKPLLIIGARDLLLKQGPAFYNSVHDLLIAPWRPEELVLRASRIITQSPKQGSAPQGSPPREHTKVVIADDDPTVRALVKATLQNYGMDCHVAEDGGQAVEMARKLCPDAVILDVNMPHYDGFEVVAALRNDASTRHAAVILLTARQQEADIIRGFRLGADDYIVKPFSPIELAVRLKRLLRRTP